MDPENTTDIYAALSKVFSDACGGSRKRHDKILKASVLEARRTHPHEVLLGFVTFLSRKLQKNETVIVGHQVLRTLNEDDSGFQKLQSLMRHLPHAYRLESMPVLARSGQPVFLVISRHAFRVSEITRDIWLVMRPDATDEEKEKNNLLVNCMHVSENLSVMGETYSQQDIIDSLNLIADRGGFFLRALFLFHMSIEPKPFTDLLEQQGFQVAFVLNEEPSTEVDPEHDFLKRLQGLLIAKTPEGLERTMVHQDFLVPLCNQIPLPKSDLTGMGQLH